VLSKSGEFFIDDRGFFWGARDFSHCQETLRNPGVFSNSLRTSQIDGRVYNMIMSAGDEVIGTQPTGLKRE
jgi:hypothetical protein